MSTIAVTATAQPSNWPPRVKVDIVDSGTPVINSVTVTRTDDSGNVAVVRTGDGNPLALTTSGPTRIGTVYDVEAPYGVPVTYSTVEYPAGVSATTTVTAGSVWLVHPGVPDRSMPVELRINSFDEEQLNVNAGVFYPMGRENAVVITDGRRKGASASFTVGTETLEELAQVRALIADAGVLLLNVPTSLGIGVDTDYIFVQAVQVKRRTDIGTDTKRDVQMPYVVVDRPAGGTQSQYSWTDVLATYSTWSALLAANSTWAAVQAPTS